MVYDSALLYVRVTERSIHKAERSIDMFFSIVSDVCESFIITSTVKLKSSTLV